MIPLLVASGILVLLLIWVISIFNRLVGLRNRFKNAYAQIDVQLKRRYDLIPNLVEATKAYLIHERGTLEAVITARNTAVHASKTAAADPTDGIAVRNAASAESGLTGALSRLLVVSENYPELKANQNVSQLTEELTSTENKVSFARQAYNDAVTTYNTGREVFPAVIVANIAGFLPAELFQVESQVERQAPKVSFS